MVSIHKRSQFWTSLPIFILLMTFLSTVTIADDADDFKVLFDKTQQGSVFYLDNGMEVILVENHANPMIAAFTIVKTGSRNEAAATNGTAHFLEHLLFNGTKTRTQKQLYDEIDFYDCGVKGKHLFGEMPILVRHVIYKNSKNSDGGFR